MMWVDTERDGWVNLAFVGSARRIAKGYNLLSPAGLSMGTVGEYLDLDERLASGLGTLADQARSGRLLLTCRISDMGAYPVVAGDNPTSSELVLIVQPDGRICNPCVQEWDNLEAAKADLLAEARKKWEERRVKPLPDKPAYARGQIEE